MSTSSSTGCAAGPKLVAAVQQRIDAFAEQYRRAFPSAVKCLLTDREQLTSCLRFPVEHHKRIRHSNFIERTFGETRRRVKVVGRLPSEASCLPLALVVLDRAARGWRGFTVTRPGCRTTYAGNCSTGAHHCDSKSNPPPTRSPVSVPWPNITTSEEAAPSHHLHRELAAPAGHRVEFIQEGRNRSPPANGLIAVEGVAVGVSVRG
jgi:hypothetical protein